MQRQVTKLDYKGKDIFVGIDTHKKDSLHVEKSLYSAKIYAICGRRWDLVSRLQTLDSRFLNEKSSGDPEAFFLPSC